MASDPTLPRLKPQANWDTASSSTSSVRACGPVTPGSLAVRSQTIDEMQVGMSQRVCLEMFTASSGGFANVSLMTGGIEALGHGIYIDDKTLDGAMQSFMRFETLNAAQFPHRMDLTLSGVVLNLSPFAFQ